MATKTTNEQVITIPALDIRTATIKIVGDSPLIVHKWSEKAKKEIGDLARSDEDVLSYVAFPQIAEKFFKEREEREHNTVSYQIRKVD